MRSTATDGGAPLLVALVQGAFYAIGALLLPTDAMRLEEVARTARPGVVEEGVPAL